MVFDFFAGDNYRESKNADAWSEGVEEADLLNTITNILSSGLGDGDELVIIIRPEFEGG